MLEDLAIIACLLAARSYDPPGMPEGTTITCISPDDMNDRWEGAAGLFYGTGDAGEIFIVSGMPDDYTRMVLAHEAGHAIDFQKGWDATGVSSFWSEVAGDMDPEAFARLYSWHVGMWPWWETFPDVIDPARVAVLVDAGVLPRLGILLADGTEVSSTATVVTPEDVGLPTHLLQCPAWSADCVPEVSTPDSYTLPAPEVRCEEDMPCWDCETMGNLICGDL